VDLIVNETRAPYVETIAWMVEATLWSARGSGSETTVGKTRSEGRGRRRGRGRSAPCVPFGALDLRDLVKARDEEGTEEGRQSKDRPVRKETEAKDEDRVVAAARPALGVRVFEALAKVIQDGRHVSSRCPVRCLAAGVVLLACREITSVVLLFQRNTKWVLSL